MTSDEAKQALKEGKTVRIMVNDGLGEIQLHGITKIGDTILEMYKDYDWEVPE